MKHPKHRQLRWGIVQHEGRTSLWQGLFAWWGLYNSFILAACNPLNMKRRYQFIEDEDMVFDSIEEAQAKAVELTGTHVPDEQIWTYQKWRYSIL